MDKYVMLDETNFDEVIKERVVLVDFFASWCVPCKMLGPIIDELAEEYSGKAVVAKLDIDESEAIALKQGVSAVPTIIVYKNGKAVKILEGFKQKEALKKIIDKLL